MIEVLGEGRWGCRRGSLDPATRCLFCARRCGLTPMPRAARPHKLAEGLHGLAAGGFQQAVVLAVVLENDVPPDPPPQVAAVVCVCSLAGVYTLEPTVSRYIYVCCVRRGLYMRYADSSAACPNPLIYMYVDECVFPLPPRTLQGPPAEEAQVWPLQIPAVTLFPKGADNATAHTASGV